MDADRAGGRPADAVGLRPDELRVLGCLVEKEATTPDNYPLTANALRNACNQSTSRDPVVSYDDADVERALTSLRERGLTRTVHSRSNRAAKYRHVLVEVLDTEPGETALLAVLMLRGPQTVGELKARTERQYEFETSAEVAEALAGLAARPQPLVVQLERQPGQKDARWVHLLGTDEPPDPPGRHGSASSPASSPVASVAGDDPPDDPARDPYGEATAEFYDLLAAHEWERLGLDLLDVLDGVDSEVGPLIDVGTGSGVGLAFIREAVPGVGVYAIEPSKAMRAALHARLSADPALRRDVTVDPRPLASATLPERACALVMTAVIGHLTDDEREQVWRYVAERMPPGAPAAIQLLPPDRPVTLPATRYSRVDVGRFAYEGWQEGEPADDRHMWWTMAYRVVDPAAGDAIVAEYVGRSRWRCLGLSELRSEVAAYGLSLDVQGDLAIVRR